MKRIIAVFAALLFLSTGLTAQSKVDQLRDREKATRDEIKRKDEERRQKIIQKFYDFQTKVLKFAPNFNIDIPVDPGQAEDIKDQNHESRPEKRKEFEAYAADSYKLRSLPYDSIKEYTGTVKRGDKVKVVMKPDMKGKKEYPSITKDWFLVRTSDGTEGYIPADLLLNKKPQPEKKKKSGFMETGAGVMYTLGDSGDPGVQLMWGFAADGLMYTDGMIVMAQYGGGDYGRGDDESKRPGAGTRMKVNTGSLKVRSDPSLEGDVIGSLYRGNVVEVIEYSSNTEYYDGHKSNWIRIRSGDFEGWVFAYYLDEAGSEEGTSGGDSGKGSEFVMTEFDTGMELYVKPDILRVRDAPDDLGTVLFSLQNKDEVEIIEVDPELVSLGGKKSKWVKIKYLDYEGWVFGAFLSTDKSAFEQGDDINNMFQTPISEGDYFISSKFGKRILKGKVSNHTGIDLAAPCGTDVKAAADGVVIMAVENYNNCGSCGYGSYVIIEHKNGFRTLYGHLSKVKVKTGQKVNSGDIIGAVGNTGHSFGCHLHFEIRAYEEYLDPASYLHP